MEIVTFWYNDFVENTLYIYLLPSSAIRTISQKRCFWKHSSKSLQTQKLVVLNHFISLDAAASDASAIEFTWSIIRQPFFSNYWLCEITVKIESLLDGVPWNNTTKFYKNVKQCLFLFIYYTTSEDQISYSSNVNNILKLWKISTKGHLRWPLYPIGSSVIITQIHPEICIIYI